MSFGTLKYINKYIYKGPDRTTMELDRNNEIKVYLNARYIAAAEACWRIYHFDMHGRTPAVVRLQVHCEGDHYVTFEGEDTAEDVLRRGGSKKTTLSEWFTANADTGALGEDARKYTYPEFPQHFTWNEARKKWTVRKQGFAIGRMYYVPPNAGPRFYLRTLLTVVKGATSFQDLLTYQGQHYGTYEEVCDRS